MSTQRHHTRETLAKNVQYLMDAREWTQDDLAREAGVSQKTVSNICNADSEVRSPQLANVEKVARAFGLEAWNLLVPDIEAELLKNQRLAHLVNRYNKMSPEGRDYVDGVADRETKYSSRQ